MQAEDLDKAVRERYDGPFLSADDIEDGKTIRVKIISIAAPKSERDAQKKVIDNAILTFEHAKKRLIINSTNEKIIRKQHGKKASEWVGKTIVLQRRYLAESFGDSNVPCVRVMLPDGMKCPKNMARFYGSDRPFSQGESG